MHGWTQCREYSVWADELPYAWAGVWKHKNGWFSVNANDGTAAKTRSQSDAYSHALSLSHEYQERAVDECGCDDDDCANPETNPYGEAHGVRLNVWSFEDDRRLELYEI